MMKVLLYPFETIREVDDGDRKRENKYWGTTKFKMALPNVHTIALGMNHCSKSWKMMYHVSSRFDDRKTYQRQLVLNKQFTGFTTCHAYTAVSEWTLHCRLHREATMMDERWLPTPVPFFVDLHFFAFSFWLLIPSCRLIKQDSNMSKQPLEGLTVRIFDPPANNTQKLTNGSRGYREYTEITGKLSERLALGVHILQSTHSHCNRHWSLEKHQL